MGDSILGASVERERTRAAWRAMFRRCYSKNSHTYKNYGERGITVCDEWKDFDTFLLDMGLSPGKKYSLDRIDNKKGYCKQNCRWVTRFEQDNNKSTTRFYDYKGKKKTLGQIIKLTGCKLRYEVVYSRIRWGWSIEKSLNTPVRHQAKR